MKKISIVVLILGFCFLGLAVASTVSTTDGVNFLVTNDVGKVANYTNDALSDEVSKANTTVQSDYSEEASKRRDILRDTEILATWQQVQNMAFNAYGQWYSNQDAPSSNENSPTS